MEGVTHVKVDTGMPAPATPSNTPASRAGSRADWPYREAKATAQHNGVKIYDDYLRRLYPGGRPTRSARVQNRVSAALFATGIWPGRLGALDVLGRRSGRLISFPVVIADFEGERYLVSMLGERANWVQNVRADEGRAVLRHGRRENVRLEEVPVEQRAPILRRYLNLAPGARPHIPVTSAAPIEEFERVAAEFPVFRIAS